MNKIINNNNFIKKTIIVLLVLLLCNFVMPVYTYALANGGIINKYLVPIVLLIPDLLLNKLQNIFIGNNVEFYDSLGQEVTVEVNKDGETGIIKETGQSVNIGDLSEVLTDEPVEIAQQDPKGGIYNYVIMYSPAVIFSGKVAGLDVNFISPMGLGNEGKVYKNWIEYTYTEKETGIDLSKEEGKNTLRNYGFDLAELTNGVNNSSTERYMLWFRC